MVDWKKEISFGGGKKKERAEAPPAAVEDGPTAEKKTSFWKKEISFGRKQVPAAEETPAVQPEEPSIAQQPAAVGLVAAYVPAARAAEAPADDDVAPVDDEPTATFPVAVPDPAPETDAKVAEVVALLAAHDAAAQAPAPSAPRVDPSLAAAAAATEPAAAPTPVASAPAAPIPAVATPVAPTPPAAVVVQPPVPAAELPPLEDDDASSRKEKRKKKKEKAKAKTEAPAPKDAEARVPFYKRELSLGKKARKDSVEPVDGEQAPAETPERPKRSRPSFSLPRPQPRVPRAPRVKGAKGGKTTRVVGLKIGASQLAAAEVSNNGHAEVLQVARQDLDPGIVTNGELREPDLLAEALREFFKQHKLPRRGVRLGIATNRIGVRTLEIPGIEDPKQLANAIRFRAQEALPIPIDEAVLDYQVLREERNEEGATVRKILLVLAYRDLIDRYVAACRQAGIQLVGIDLEAFALLRALAAPREEATPAQAALVAVAVGHDRTTFAVSDGRVCEFTRVLDWGGHSLNVAVARALDQAPSEVDAIKRALSLDGQEVPEGLSAEEAQAAREAIRRQVQAFARELVSSLQFYQNQPGSLGIGEIVLTGGTAHLGGFAEELQRLIGVRVRIGDPLVRVKLSKKLREPEQLGSFTVAIGLGIDD